MGLPVVGLSSACGLLGTTVQLSVTHFSHNLQDLNMLPTGNIHDSMPMKLLVYETVSGQRPFIEWFERLDGQRQASVRRRLRAGEEHDHLGDCSSLRGGLYEMRLAGRIGLRIYFASVGGAIVLLLGGSGKSNQRRAIKRARERLKDFRERNSE
jgi:putative addiction module killer protein